jgi:GTPase SAR1 family protein
VQQVSEFKLVFIGNAGVGKTTLARQLSGIDGGESTATTGLQISPLQATIEGREVLAHVWDFGGHGQAATAPDLVGRRALMSRLGSRRRSAPLQRR